MKIAFVTEDGKTISRHFGRAPYYLVMTIEEGKIVEREMREKIGHSQLGAHERAGNGHPCGTAHGNEELSHEKHVRMSQAIADCTAVICAGMGMGAYESLSRLNIRPIVTDLSDIEAAAQAYLSGTLTDHVERLH